MGANPKPQDFSVINNAHCSIVDTDAYRINWSAGMNSLKLQAWVVWIIFKLDICNFCLLLNIHRQSGIQLPKLFCRMRNHRSSKFKSLVLPARWSLKASSARLAKKSSDSANNESHFFSANNSSSNHRAIIFCCISGSLDAS